MGNKSLRGYVRLNMQRMLYQGKSIVVFVCVTVFFMIYYGEVRGELLQMGQEIGVYEFFPAIMNTNSCAFIVWMGYLLLICDLPFDENGFEQYLTRAGKKSWLYGQLVYLFIMTVIYFGWLQLLIFLLLVPQAAFQGEWTDGFVKMINSPNIFGIERRFVFPFSIIREQSPLAVYGKEMLLCIFCGCSVGSVMICLNMLWKNGAGMAFGGIGIAWDYFVSVVIYFEYWPYYISPITLTRIGCLSNSDLNSLFPSFRYACCFFGGIFIAACVVMSIAIKRHEF